MSQFTTQRNTKISNKSTNRNRLFLPSYAFTFLTTFAGVAFGILLSIGIMGPMLHDQVAAATKDLRSQVLVASPASAALNCTSPTTGSSGGRVMGANTQQSSNVPGGNGGNGSNGGGSTTKTIFVHKLVSGVFATTTASNSNTGPGSTNTITTTNTNTTTVNNDNDISLTNNNSQSATSGNATTTNNTSSGATTTGAATNKSDTSYDLKITN